MVWAKFWIMISFDGVYIYSSELFPTVVRYVQNIGVHCWREVYTDVQSKLHVRPSIVRHHLQKH